MNSYPLNPISNLYSAIPIVLKFVAVLINSGFLTE